MASAQKKGAPQPAAGKAQVISDTFVGIILMEIHNCLISNNVFDSNKVHGIFLTHSSNNNISKNTVSNCFRGITSDISDNNIILGNTISSNKIYGIRLFISNNNIVSSNAIKSNGIGERGIGLVLEQSSNNEISYNNFLQNAMQASFLNCSSTKWYKNYWNRPRLLPKLIFGRKTIMGFQFFPWFNIDWRPAKEPYDIEI